MARRSWMGNAVLDAEGMIEIRRSCGLERGEYRYPMAGLYGEDVAAGDASIAVSWDSESGSCSHLQYQDHMQQSPQPYPAIPILPTVHLLP